MSDSTRGTEKRSYKDTLNLPVTRFAMKANLVEREPRFQQHWREIDLYGRIRAQAAGRPRYVLHDGPPYANGSIHLGHLLNKVLKDLVVRSRNMLGFDAPFVPGWDCHGLPIEHHVVKELGAKASTLGPREIRERCGSTARKFIDLQAGQMQRLGTLGDYADPYHTMQPSYEAATLEVFAELVEQGLVYRALRPVHWSIAHRTALADAELEYRDREDRSVFVRFEIESTSGLPRSLDPPPGERVSLLIWTTTPWTLPANMAVALAPAAEYGLYRYERDGGSGAILLATALEGQVLGRLGVSFTRRGVCRGEELRAAGVRYRHPFVDRSGPIISAAYVTLEDGTGLVHTAPGHGAEDFESGVANGLPLYCPVREDGTFDDSVPDWIRGKSVWEGNDLIVERLRRSGHLFHDERFRHSYPHDWRSKTPTIFRATEQWFVAVDHPRRSLRGLALEVTGSRVRFVPEWGRNRMRGMLESRPDWCISRQRAWGLPIPAFFGPAAGQVLLTAASVRAVASRVRRSGSDEWFRAGAADLLEGYDARADPAAPEWLRGDPGLVARLEKGADIFDVWFESGSSWHAVVDGRGLDYPVDLYLEGSDQHRGWFQLSLLLALGFRQHEPFRAVLTHGFMVDIEGKKMSKSVGNTLEVEDLLRRFGADVCRFWVASLNFENDIKVDEKLFQIAGEEYRKVRNTIRFLLGNLGDFDPARHRRELTERDRVSLDAWAAAELAKVVRTVRDAYAAYHFRRVHEAVFCFCNETLSAVYLAAIKDRLYCDRVDSDRRRRTQTVMYDIADALIRMVAPVLVHTAEEAHLALAGRDPDQPADPDSVHLGRLPEPVGVGVDPGWEVAMDLRSRVLKALEVVRDGRGLANPLDAGIRIELPGERLRPLEAFVPEMADLCGVSRFALAEAAAEAIHVDDLTAEPRCDRSWKRDGTVRPRSDGGLLTDRDAEAVGV